MSETDSPTLDSPATATAEPMTTPAPEASSPNPPETSASPEERRATYRAALDRLAAGDQGDSTPPAAADAGDKSQTRSDPPQDAEPDEPAAEAGTPDPSAGAEPDTGRLEKAIKALRRAQYPDDILDSLDSQRILEIGEKLAKSQAEQDSAHRRQAELQAQLEKLQAGGNAGTEPDEPGQASGQTGAAQPQSPPPEAPAPLSEQVNQAITDALSSADDADEFETLTAADYRQSLGVTLTTFAEKLDQHYQAQAQQLVEQRVEPVLDALAGVVNDLDELQARRVLQDQPDLLQAYPDLRSPDAFERVMSKTREFMNLKSYHRTGGGLAWDRLVKDAARTVLPEPNPVKATQAQMAQNQKLVEQGQPELDSGGEQRPRQLSRRERLRMVTDQLAAGKTPDEARSIIRDASA